VIEDGELDVIHHDRRVATLGQGDYSGEIALLLHVRRTATETPATLLSLEREGFLGEVTGHSVLRKAVDVVVEERIHEDEDVDAVEEP
jgi:CRP-like cAMP-binding protein